jgi:hypothetical protein
MPKLSRPKIRLQIILKIKRHFADVLAVFGVLKKKYS